MTGSLATVKKALQAYVDKDRAAIERLIAEDHHFTSSLDNVIDRATYFSRCWPNSDAMTAVTHGAEDGEFAWVVYEARMMTNKRFRNAELHKVRDGKLVDTQVYFGWDLPHKAPAGAFIDRKDEG